MLTVDGVGADKSARGDADTLEADRGRTFFLIGRLRVRIRGDGCIHDRRVTGGKTGRGRVERRRGEFYFHGGSSEFADFHRGFRSASVHRSGDSASFFDLLIAFG